MVVGRAPLPTLPKVVPATFTNPVSHTSQEGLPQLQQFSDAVITESVEDILAIVLSGDKTALAQAA
ncbi:MAG: hypothetical protein WAW16_05285, partial [Candidatus Cryosericum sp.]